MIYLLDTNACIVYLNGRNLNLKRQIEQELESDIAVCSPVKAELFYGALKSNIAIPKHMKYTPPALSRTLPLPRGGLGRGDFVLHQSWKRYKIPGSLKKSGI
jgi:hypothetical protein